MRINLFGGPGSGKSTAAARLFGQLRVLGYQLELVTEFCKPWAYANRPILGFDQLYILASQLHTEDTLLRNGVPHLVTDAPPLLQAFYATEQGAPGYLAVVEMAHEFDRAYPAFNVLLDRGDLPYRREGRYQTEDEADAVRPRLLEYLRGHRVEYTDCETKDWNRLLHLVTTNLGAQ